MPNLIPEFQIAGASDPGKQRTKNEDYFLTATMRRSLQVHQATIPAGTAAPPQWFAGQSEGTLLVVADGFGQHEGALASRLAVEHIAEHFLNTTPWLNADDPNNPSRNSIPEIRRNLLEAVAHSDDVLRSAASEQPERSLRTTLTLAYIQWPLAYIAHVGGNRAYLLRKQTMSCITSDHTLAEQLTQKGIPGIEPGSYLHHVLWNALGASEPAKPQLQKLNLEAGDKLLLCSDGITKHLPDPIIQALWEQQREAQLFVNSLILAANEAGGKDNITAVAAHFGH